MSINELISACINSYITSPSQSLLEGDIATHSHVIMIITVCKPQHFSQALFLEVTVGWFAL